MVRRGRRGACSPTRGRRARRERRASTAAGGEVELELEAARVLPVAAAQRQLVHVLGGAARRVRILLVVGPVDAHHLGGEQQELALVDQRQRRRARRLLGSRRRRGGAGRGVLARSARARRPRPLGALARAGRDGPRPRAARAGAAGSRAAGAAAALPVEAGAFHHHGPELGIGTGAPRRPLATLSTRRSSAGSRRCGHSASNAAARRAPGASPGTGRARRIVALVRRAQAGEVRPERVGSGSRRLGAWARKAVSQSTGRG